MPKVTLLETKFRRGPKVTLLATEFWPESKVIQLVTEFRPESKVIQLVTEFTLEPRSPVSLPSAPFPLPSFEKQFLPWGHGNFMLSHRTLWVV